MTTSQPRYIEGCPSDKWEEAQSAQHQPFIWVQHCGSQFAGTPAKSIEDLLQMMATYKLRKDWSRPVYRDGIPEELDFYTVDPRRGIENPDFVLWADDSRIKPRFIDGERLYHADGVVRFCGNFEHYSFGFGIDTNEPETKRKLIAAIRANLKNWDRLK